MVLTSVYKVCVVVAQNAGNRATHQGKHRSRPPDAAVFVMNVPFGQGGMHVSTTGLLRRFHNH